MSTRELRWPPGWPRTRRKESGSIFDRRDAFERRPITLDRAERLLRHELDMLGASRVIVTAGDCAAAVYFIRNGTQFVMAVDRFDSNAANLRSIGLAISAMRTLERHGGSGMMDRAFGRLSWWRARSGGLRPEPADEMASSGKGRSCLNQVSA